ncbi:MAG: radical SAM protein [Deltaproteobacteria bacterium]|nr:radical SAM protein [Deltaproteobacteria bacterium]
MTDNILQSQIEKGRLTDSGRFPKVILIDTISFCDLKCSMCGHKDMTRKRGKMSMQLFRKIIDEIAETNKDTRVWMVFFGEALILKKTTLFPMIRYAKEKGLTDVVLNSNANLLDEDAAEGLIKSGLDAIYIGIDAFTEKTYAKVRVGGDYHKVVSNVRNLVRLKKEMAAEKPLVYVQFVEMEVNSIEVNNFIEFWKKEGAIAKIRPMVSWAGLVHASNLTIPKENRWPCYWAMQTMSIADDGRVVMCAVDVDARFIAGDINQESIKSVWNGKLKDIRKLHHKGEFNKLPFPCRDCKDWQSARADYHIIKECK